MGMQIPNVNAKERRELRSLFSSYGFDLFFFVQVSICFCRDISLFLEISLVFACLLVVFEDTIFTELKLTLS